MAARSSSACPLAAARRHRGRSASVRLQLGAAGLGGPRREVGVLERVLERERGGGVAGRHGVGSLHCIGRSEWGRVQQVHDLGGVGRPGRPGALDETIALLADGWLGLRAHRSMLTQQAADAHRQLESGI